LRELASGLTGKHADGRPLDGHQHACFIIHYGQAEDASGVVPTRLIAWRRDLFSEQERQAILAAAAQDLELSYRQDAWAVRLVPLDRAAPPPPGFADKPQRSWQTVTPYVPPRHVLDRRGRAKSGESVAEQIRSELTIRGLPGDKVSITVVPSSPWVRVHQTQRDRGSATNSEKCGYHMRLDFPEPVSGPIALGHSAHFGLGLFVPTTPSLKDER
jgi:CRISPR-associated protein Csb2